MRHKTPWPATSQYEGGRNYHGQSIPSLKLTVRTRKWMVGILVSFWVSAYFHGRTASFRECIIFHQPRFPTAIFGGFPETSPTFLGAQKRLCMDSFGPRKFTEKIFKSQNPPTDQQSRKPTYLQHVFFFFCGRVSMLFLKGFPPEIPT